MKHGTTQQGLDPQHMLTCHAELDSLYFTGNVQAYEQAWQEAVQQGEQTFPGFPLACVELDNAGREREPLGSVRHVVSPSERGERMSIDLHTLANQARELGYSTAEQIINRLARMIIRNEAYLSRRAGRGTHTSHDDTTAEDMVVIALVSTITASSHQ